MAVLGIDEVGRGPWAGPLVIGAVILPEHQPAWVDELQDSKKLTATKRQKLSDLILAEAPAVGLGWVKSYEIDEIGIAAALKLATKRAIAAIKRSPQGSQAKFDHIIIDGTTNFLADTPLEHRASVIVKGDSLIKEISAASIVAKVARDDYMRRVADLYPQYSFASHKGYGTKLHRDAITTHGICPQHRISIKPIQKLLGMLPTPEEKAAARAEKRQQKTTTLGHKAEQIVATHLTSQGHQILIQNYKTQICEIDIVSLHGAELYFTEVKYRCDASRGSGLFAITPTKKRQMEFAAKVFLHNHPIFSTYQPLLAAAEVSGEDFTITDFLTLTE